MAEKERTLLPARKRAGVFFKIELDEMDLLTVDIKLIRAELHLLRLAALDLNARATSLEKRVAKLITPTWPIDLAKLLKERRPDLRRV